jgi:hypothetical protein
VQDFHHPRNSPTNQTFAVTPDEAAENEESTASGTTTANRGARQHSVSGLDDATEYDIQLSRAPTWTWTWMGMAL